MSVALLTENIRDCLRIAARSQRGFSYGFVAKMAGCDDFHIGTRRKLMAAMERLMEEDFQRRQAGHGHLTTALLTNKKGHIGCGFWQKLEQLGLPVPEAERDQFLADERAHLFTQYHVA